MSQSSLEQCADPDYWTGDDVKLADGSVLYNFYADDDPGKHFVWRKGSNPRVSVRTIREDDIHAASVRLIPEIEASTPWPRYVEQPDGTYGPRAEGGMLACIDRLHNEYLVGPHDWAVHDEMVAGEVWASLNPQEQMEIEHLWAAMKLGPNDDWY